jgi:hypothetical protein
MTKRMVTLTGYGAGSSSCSIAGASVTNSTDRELPTEVASVAACTRFGQYVDG